MRKKTAIVLACHRSGTKMISECMNAGGILYGYSRLVGRKHDWSGPKAAKWVIEKGSVDGYKNGSPLLLLDYGIGGPYKSLAEYANLDDDQFIIETTEEAGEHRITWLNNVILALNGGLKWDRAAHLDIDGFRGEIMDIFRESMRKLSNAIIEDYNQKTDYWGIKDPRMVSTFSFWERVFKQFDNELKIVYIYRNPMAVARGARRKA